VSTVTTNGGANDGSSMTIFEPVPPEESGPQVRLVVSAHFRQSITWGWNPPTPPPAPAWLSNLSQITVSVPFALPLIRSGGFLYHDPPVVRQGIGVQVQSLAYSSSTTAFYGPSGGASVELLFSGLPANMELLSFIRLTARTTILGGTLGDSGPGRIDLQIPGMTLGAPEFTLMQDPTWPSNSGGTSVEPTVGPTGTVRLLVSFQGNGTPNGQPATLTISQIQLLSGGIDGNTGSPPMLPDFQLTLPMSANAVVNKTA
ncbi:MAG: hypothetical protein ACHQ4H_18365, partial [Ktedonobacterales bacterium]